MISVGVAVEEIEVPAGTAMAGFAARSHGSTGVLDPTTVRGLVLDGVAIVSVDVCALHERTCTAVRSAVTDDVRACIVSATHTHSGPACAGGRVGPDQPFIEQAIVDAAVSVVHRATQSARPCTLTWAQQRGLGIAHDRRHGTAIDPPLSQLTARDDDGNAVAHLVHFACHPVVIDGSHTEISGDYPAQLRQSLEADGSTALFVTGCAGDINTGHKAEASYSPGSPGRTPREAHRIGRALAARLATAPQHTIAAEDATFTHRDVELDIDFPDPGHVGDQRQAWTLAQEGAAPGRQALLTTWIQWAADYLSEPRHAATWSGRVSLLRVGSLRMIFLPGEPFLQTAERLDVRAHDVLGPGATLVVGYSDGVPGYLPPREEYRHGGYEVLDAHRYYAMPGPFTPGSAERLEDAVGELLEGRGC